MAYSDLLILLFQREIQISDFTQWISGETVENIDNGFSRSGFSLYVLNFIQQQTSSLFSTSNGDKQVELKLRNESTKKLPSSASESNQKHETNEHEMQRRTSTLQINNCIQPLSPPSAHPFVPDTSIPFPSLNNEEKTPDFKRYPEKHCRSPAGFNYYNNQNQHYQHFSQQTTCNSSPRITSKQSPSRTGPTLGDFITRSHKKPLLTANSQQNVSVDKSYRGERQYVFNRSTEIPIDSLEFNSKFPIDYQNFPELSVNKRGNQRSRQHSYSNTSTCVTPAKDTIRNVNQNDSPQSSTPPRSPKKSNPFREPQRLKKEKNGKRRVNPTPIKVPSDIDSKDMQIKVNTAFGSAVRMMPSRSSPFHQSATVEPRMNYDEERLILKQKRNEPLISTNCNSQAVILPNAPVLNVISPDPSKVTYFDYIVCLADIYSVLLDFNLVPNITAEIHFVFSLLTVQVKKKPVKNNQKNVKEAIRKVIQEQNECRDNSVNTNEVDNINDQIASNVENSLLITDEQISTSSQNLVTSSSDIACYQNILNNIHNSVLFAIEVIQKQMHVIKTLDRTTLRLLTDNDRLNLYAPSFASKLNEIYKKKDVLIKNAVSQSIGRVLDETVKFQSDTDNRDNFTSPSSFSHFRKQRDMFYDILHFWRTRHDEPNRDKILQLLALSSDPVNMTHLARLVCCQLISDVMNKTDENGGPPDDNLLPGINRDKLSMLEARLKDPQRRDQCLPRPPSQFLGDQHFYKYFLEVTSQNSNFREHIIDCFIARILDLDDVKFELDEADSRRTEIMYEFKHTVILSCLLAKFLGFVVFLPYRRDPDLPENIVETQISTRQKVQPPLDLVVCLQKSLHQRNLLQTVPWVIEYIGMMDCISPFLSCYRPVFQILIKIYHFTSPLYFFKIIEKEADEKHFNNACSNIDANGEKLDNVLQMSYASALLLRLYLGWLFDSSFFPEPLFFSLVGNSEDFLPSQDEDVRNFSLDSSDFIDEQFIFECCPYFLQFKLLLMANASLKGGSVRHITPVPAQINSTSESTLSKVLELQMEDNFLSGQVPSLRTTLDFIKERVASACIKNICSNLIARAKQEAINKLNNSKIKSNKEKNDVMKQCIAELIIEIDSTVSAFCEPRIRNSLEALFGIELLDQKILNISLRITNRRCKEKIIDWLNSHINLKDVFTKLTVQHDIVEDKGPHTSDTKIQAGREIGPCYNTDENNLLLNQYPSESQIEVIIFVRDLICDIIDGEILDLNEGKVMEVLQRIRNVSSLDCSLLITLSVDLVIILVAYLPDILTQSLLSDFGKFWAGVELQKQETENPFQHIICPRNILLFCQQNATTSWTALSRFFIYTLSNNFLTLHQFELQCIAIFRHPWPPATFKFISNCLKSILERLKQENICQNDEKLILMLELVSETSQDIEDGLCNED